MRQKMGSGEFKGIRQDLIPIIFKVVSDAERLLLSLTSYRIDLIMRLSSKDVLSEDQALQIMLQKNICETFQVTWSQLMGPRGITHISDARRVYMYLGKTILGLTCTALAKELNRNHTTVLSGQKKVEEWISINDPICQKLNIVKSNLYEHNPQTEIH